MSNNHTRAEEKKNEKETPRLHDLHVHTDVFSVTNQLADDGPPAPKEHPNSSSTVYYYASVYGFETRVWA